MPNTFSAIYLHLVYTVKGRDNLISKDWKEELYKFTTGIVNNYKQKLLAINGTQDHIHILLSISPDIRIGDLIREIKANSSRFINEKGYVKGNFEWQIGYGIFSVSNSQIGKVIKYIMNQEEHHRKSTFKEEYIKFLKEFGMAEEDKFQFKWVEE